MSTAHMVDRVVLQPALRNSMGVCQGTLRRWKLAGKLPPPDVQLSYKEGCRLAAIDVGGRGHQSALASLPRLG